MSDNTESLITLNHLNVFKEENDKIYSTKTELNNLNTEFITLQENIEQTYTTQVSFETYKKQVEQDYLKKSDITEPDLTGYVKEEQLNNYYTKNEVYTKNDINTNYYTKNYIDDINDNYYTKNYIDDNYQKKITGTKGQFVVINSEGILEAVSIDHDLTYGTTEEE